MFICEDDIQNRRTPHELREFVNTTREAAVACGEKRHRGMLKKGLYKVFLDELVPLSWQEQPLSV